MAGLVKSIVTQRRPSWSFSPLRWDRSTGQLLLARRLIVKVKFRGKVPGEKSLGGSRGRKRRKKNASTANVVANLVTHDSGLYGVSYQSLFGNRRRSVKTRKLNLTYQGETVAFTVHPNKKQFKRGSRLYFVSGGEEPSMSSPPPAVARRWNGAPHLLRAPRSGITGRH